MRGVLPGPLAPAVIDHLVELAEDFGGSWRRRYLGHPRARVLIFGDRLRVFVPVSGSAA